MSERFTDQARHVVVAAQEDARRRRAGEIGTEHILMGLLATPREPGALDRAAERRRGTKRRRGHIPFGRPAKRALGSSLREAQNLRHRFLGTEHLLLGVLAVEDGLAARLLAGRGLTLAETRAAVADRTRGAAGA